MTKRQKPPLVTWPLMAERNLAAAKEGTERKLWTKLEAGEMREQEGEIRRFGGGGVREDAKKFVITAAKTRESHGQQRD